MSAPLASSSKRRDSGDSSSRSGGEREDQGLEKGEPPLSLLPGGPRGPGEEPQDAQPPEVGGDHGAGRTGPPRQDRGFAPLQHNEEFCLYNTLQYWRNPLPLVDLSDIEDVSGNNQTEATLAWQE